MTRFALRFVALVLPLFALQLTAPVQRAVVLPWTELLAAMALAVIRVFDAQVVAVGRVIQSARTGFGVSIESGCNGVEATLILVAAILAWPATWRQKLAGLAGGIVAVQALNLARVASLFWLGQWSATAFEWAHLYLWQALIMVDVLIVWLLWLRWVRRDDAKAAA